VYDLGAGGSIQQPMRTMLPLLFALFVLSASCGRSQAQEVDTSQCTALLADPATPTNAQQATAARQSGTHWSDAQIRTFYVCKIATIHGQTQAAGQSRESAAKLAYNTRHQARLTARAMMSNRAEVALLEARDKQKYGDPSGPGWDWLVKKNRAKGLKGDAVYEEIIASSLQTNQAINGLQGL
jgi:glycerol-3-phosphate dehydrogenase